MRHSIFYLLCSLFFQSALIAENPYGVNPYRKAALAYDLYHAESDVRGMDEIIQRIQEFVAEQYATAGLEEPDDLARDESLAAFVREHFDAEQYSSVIINEYKSGFTEGELKQLVEFFDTELGGKYAKVASKADRNKERLFRRDFNKLSRDLWQLMGQVAQDSGQKFASPNAGYTTEDLVGEWREEGYDGDYYISDFRADGTMVFTHYDTDGNEDPFFEGTWELSGDVISYTSSDEREPWKHQSIWRYNGRKILYENSYPKTERTELGSMRRIKKEVSADEAEPEVIAETVGEAVYKTEDLIGRWQEEWKNGVSVVSDFKADGTMLVTWYDEGEELAKQERLWAFVNNVMIFRMSPDDDDPVRETVLRIEGGRMTYRDVNGDTAGMVRLDDEPAQQLEKELVFYTAEDLVGVWRKNFSGRVVDMDFRADGTLIVSSYLDQGGGERSNSPVFWELVDNVIVVRTSPDDPEPRKSTLLSIDDEQMTQLFASGATVVRFRVEDEHAQELEEDIETTSEARVVNGQYIPSKAVQEKMQSEWSLNIDRQIKFDMAMKKLNQRALDWKPVVQNRKVGFKDSVNSIVIECKYDSVYKFDESGLAAVLLGEGWGFINSLGELVIDAQYQRVDSFGGNDLTRVKRGDKYGLINQRGEEVLPLKYTTIRDFGEKEYAVVETSWGSSSTGLISKAGVEVIPCLYDDIKTLEVASDHEHTNIWLCYKKSSEGNYNIKLYDVNKKLFVGSKYQEIKVRSDHNEVELWPAFKDKKWGYIDRSGQEVIPCIYDRFYFDGNTHFDKSGMIKLRRQGQWHFVDHTGKEVLVESHLVVLNFDPAYNLARFRSASTELWGVINLEGDVVIAADYHNLSSFIDGLSIARNRNYKYGMIDPNGRVMIPFVYDSLTAFGDDGLAVASKNDKYGIINKQGETVVPFAYDWLSSGYGGTIFDSNGLTSAKLGEKWGMINRAGNQIIPIKYTKVVEESDSRYGVLIDKKWGMVGSRGNELLPCVYDYPFDSSDSRVDVFVKNGKKGLLYKDGTLFQRAVYDDIRLYETEDAIRVVYKGKDGFIDFKGNLLLPIVYDLAYSNDIGYVVRKNGKWGLVDKSHKTIIPCKYDPDFVTFEKLESGLYKFRLRDEGYNTVKSGFMDELGNSTFEY